MFASLQSHDHDSLQKYANIIMYILTSLCEAKCIYTIAILIMKDKHEQCIILYPSLICIQEAMTFEDYYSYYYGMPHVQMRIA